MAKEQCILIVEDDEDISMIEEAYLQSAGFQTQIVSNGEAVADLLGQQHFDLILLDVMLPGKSGYEICKEIREQVDIPILMVTARTESIDKIRGLGIGADDYIPKPFDPAELVARVHAHLRQYQRMQEKFSGVNAVPQEEIRIQDVRILVNSWKVYKGEKEIKFPNREFELLSFLPKILILYFQRSSFLKRYGDMTMSETALQSWCISTAFGKK